MGHGLHASALTEEAPALTANHPAMPEAGRRRKAGRDMMQMAGYGALAAALAAGVCASAAADGGRCAVPFTAVSVTDTFWGPKHQVYRDRSIPHSWQYVSREIEDNEIAAGWKQIERGQDTPWNQANLHKVLESCAYALGQTHDAALGAKVDGIIRAIAGAQQANGYVNALITVRHMTPWANLDGQHDGYVAGHLIEAAVAHFQATGERSFLDVACRLADHIYRTFITEGQPGVCGHAELELALVRLYRVTGEGRYLALAREWIERRGHAWEGKGATPRGYFMDHLPIREVPEVTGHAVRTMFYLAGAADVANEAGDASLAEAARRLWTDTVERKMYLTGSVGSQASDEGFGAAYDLPNDGYCESCAACGLVYFAQAMFMLDGDSGSMDVLERVLYNAVLHGVSLDGTTTYYRNPLSDGNHVRDNCWVCCPPCLSRTLLRMPEYVYARGQDGLYVNLYVGGKLTTTVAGSDLELTQETRYPWEGQVRLTLAPARAATWSLRLRLPGWCQGASVRVNGEAVEAPVERGYAVLRREWKAGDVVDLDLPMPVQRGKARPEVAADRGLVALQRGPLVYGFEGVDNGGDVDLTLPGGAPFGVEHRPDLLGGVTVIRTRAADGREVQAIPFYALANREASRQVVWVKDGDEGQ
jgi:uncharacterized protein